MKRLPLSRKAVALTLAAVMATTPFAGAVAAVDGNTSVEMAQEDVASVEQLVTDMEAIYASLNAEDQATISEMRTVIEGLSDSAWERAVPQVMIDNVDAELGEGETAAIMKEIAMVLTTVGEGNLQQAVDEFRDERSSDFGAVFNGNIDVDDLLVVFNEMRDQLVAFMNEGDRRSMTREDLAQALSFVDLEAFIRDRLTLGDINDHFFDGTGVYLVDTDNENDIISFIPDVRDLIIEEGTFDDEEIRDFTAGLLLASVDYYDPLDKVVTERENGTVIVRVIEEQYIQYLEELAEVPDTLTLDIDKNEGEEGEVLIPSAVIEKVKELNPNAKFEITSLEGSISIRVASLDTDELRTSLGIPAGDDFTMQIEVEPGTDSADVIGQEDFDVKSPIVKFSMHAVANGTSYPLERFAHSLTRTIEADEALTPGNTVVVRLNEDGSFTPMTTKVDGNVATFQGFSNSNYVVIENETSYPDVPENHWAHDEISDLSAQFIIRGFLDGDFRPADPTRRSQFAALVARSFSLIPEADYTEPFSDVPSGHSLEQEIFATSSYGIIQGYGDSTFRPENEITRAEAALMITRVMDLLDDVEFDLDQSVDYTVYTDSSRFSDRQQDAITRVTQAGIMQGRGDGSFRPDDNANRGQLSLMLHRLLVSADYINPAE